MATLRIYDVISDKSNVCKFSIYVVIADKFKIWKIINIIERSYINQEVFFVIAKELHVGHRIRDHLNTSRVELGYDVMKVTAYIV